MMRIPENRARTRPLVGSYQKKSKYWWIFSLLPLFDAAAVSIGLLSAYLLRFEANFAFFYDVQASAVTHYVHLIIVFVPASLLVLALFGLYDTQKLFSGLDEYARVFNAGTTGIMLVMVATFFLPGLIIARGWVLLSWFSVTATVMLNRFAVRRLVFRMRARGYFRIPMLIVGADEEGRAIAEQLRTNPASGVSVKGFIDDRLPRGAHVVDGLRVLGTTDSLHTLVYQFGVKELAISASALEREKLLDIFRTFGNTDEVQLRLSSGLFEIMTTGVQVKSVGHVPLLSVNRVRLSREEVALKRIVDVVGALAGLLVLAPVFATIAFLIKRNSPGPVFYRRRVVGSGGQEFDAFKFRTMVVNADEVLERNPELKAEYAHNFKLKRDPRVTRIGEFLRKTSIDELPQLFNVLRGEMSLVGPRMIVKDEMDKYGKWDMNLLTVKPGITGLWQVCGRSDIDYEGRVRLDMYYIRNYTVWLDLQILLHTLPAVLLKKGAY